ncbi:MAG: sugar phosphate isomerase/epimerase family protein [Methanoregula sp.]|jgi:sugar phosphate isomerase/epimerase|uniref:sugar phosphate isomerase/epimerase family protein n=1 Tax=Methanoregula sp. TaxID=2052170 RepID=UPI003C75616C
MIGISTYCLIEEPLSDALDRLSGLTDRIEVMDEGLHFAESPEIFGSYSADFTIHAPFHGLNIACVFEPIRTASIGVITDCFAVAAEIGAPVVLHPGYFAWENERELADRQFRKSLAELTAAAREFSVEFSFENMGSMNFFNLRTPDDLAIIGDSKFTLDVGHANLNGCLPGFLKTLFSHMHLHDNTGKQDSHSTVGEGNIDFHQVISAMKRKNATAIIEVKSFDGAVKSLRALEAL